MPLRPLVILVLALQVSCSGAADAPPAPTTEPSPGPTPSTPAPLPSSNPEQAPALDLPAPSGDPATACARARPCCAAFAETIGDDAEAERARIACEQMDQIEELGPASGEACLAAIDGWRRALELAEREIPGACL